MLVKISVYKGVTYGNIRVVQILRLQESGFGLEGKIRDGSL